MTALKYLLHLDVGSIVFLKRGAVALKSKTLIKPDGAHAGIKPETAHASLARLILKRADKDST